MELLNAIIHTVYQILNWAPWIVGGGAVMWIALVIAAMFLAPAAQLLGALSPLLKGACELVVGFIRAMISGAVDMLDNASSILFVVTVAGIAGWYMYNHPNCPAPRAPMIYGHVKADTAKPSLVQKYFPKLQSYAKPKPTSAPKPVVKDDDSNSLVKPFWKE